MRACNPSALGLDRCPTGGLAERTRCADCEREYQRRYNARPERKALYGGEWQRHRRERMAEQPHCSVGGCASADLTVDHGTDWVLCRSHHLALEARRKRGEPDTLEPSGGRDA